VPVSLISHLSLPYNMVQTTNYVILLPIVSEPFQLDSLGKILGLALTVSELCV